MGYIIWQICFATEYGDISFKRGGVGYETVEQADRDGCVGERYCHVGLGMGIILVFNEAYCCAGIMVGWMGGLGLWCRSDYPPIDYDLWKSQGQGMA